VNFKLAAVATAVAATLALAACGGGGNDGGSFAPIGGIVPPAPPAPPPPPPPPPAPAPAPATSTFMYDQLPLRTDVPSLEADFNAQGARGYRFLGPVNTANLYVKSGDATYVYELKTEPATPADFLTQANEAGSRGFRWGGAVFAGGTAVMIYRKDSGAAATYTYRNDTPAADAADYVARGGAQGADGYYNSVPAYIFGGSAVAVFEKSSLAAGSTFGYEVGSSTADTAATLAQMEERGSRGFRYRGPFSFGNLYVKDLSQAATFSYQALPDLASITDLIVQADGVGASGYAFIGPMVAGAETRIYYYKAGNCTSSVVCGPVGPFGL
jgi:hypothetical protein